MGRSVLEVKFYIMFISKNSVYTERQSGTLYGGYYITKVERMGKH
jgi:hypothetical protein